ncbi:MAG: glycosyltransferase family 25 protein [Thermoguttaceae bacterium]
MEVLYINLERRPDRNDLFLRTNAGIADFRRIEAVDGRCLDVQDLIRQGLLARPLRAYTAGALGHALSQKKIWQQCISTAATATVAEDDAVFNRHFADKAGKTLAALPPDWDIIFWGWNFDALLHVEVIEGLKQAFLRFDAGRLGPRLREFQELDYSVLPVRLRGVFGTPCYSISPRGARRLSELCFPLRREPVFVASLGRTLPNANLDTLMNKHYGSLKAYAALPPLVWTENDKRASDIHSKASWCTRLWNYLLDSVGA